MLKKENQKPHQGWKRADRIAGATVLIGLATLMIPYMKQLPRMWRVLERRSARQLTASMWSNTFEVTGTAARIPAADDLWLVSRPSIQHRWYPITRLSVTGGE